MFRGMMLCALIAAAFGFAQQANVVVPTVALEDQFENARDVSQHRGEVVVLIYGDRASATANKELGERVHVHFHPAARGLPPARARQVPVAPIPGHMGKSPDVLAIPVACIGKVPNLVKRVLRGQIRSGSPEVPVWLDFGEVMKSQFPFKAGVPNVVVLDAQGRYRYAAAGVPTSEGMTRLLGTIEALRREAIATK